MNNNILYNILIIVLCQGTMVNRQNPAKVGPSPEFITPRKGRRAPPPLLATHRAEAGHPTGNGGEICVAT